MNFITHNPYRIIGITANASAREIQARKGKIQAYAKVGKQITSEFDFSFLQSIKRDSIILEKAVSDIEQNQNKVIHSLFWFTNSNPVDNTAIQYLVGGQRFKAIEIWGKLTQNKEINSKNFSAFNNIGTLYLLEENKEKIKHGITSKIKLIESESFIDFVHSVADETFSIDKNKQIETLINQLLIQFKNKYSISETMELFSSCNGNIQKYLSKKFTEGPIHKIEIHIEQTKNKRSKKKIDSFRFGRELYDNTKSDLTLLKSILGNTNLQYKILADNIAKELLQCSVDYFNESQALKKSNNYLEDSLKISKWAESVAVSEATKSKVREDIKTIEGMKDKELNQAIAILSSIKFAYEKAITEIDVQVAKMRITMSFNQSINYSKIDNMKAKCLNWDKVVELVSNGINANDANIIQRSSNQTKINEYKELVNFLFSKLGPFQINKLKHLCYWKDVTPQQAKSTAKQVGSTIGKATDGCYIATMAYGSYEHPKVLELRKFRDEILRKTLAGRLFIKIYYSISPKLVKILKNNKTINDLIRKGLNQFIKLLK
ncbi:hypothetical protein LUD75_07595 [Epilithonimonas sp. JDS]|uniref:CFI-box-CTERM domain-containing protein n=1 Tax=Epilithonimonas sp. JDS TaxID=2902797 RepID=UPI001E58268A|nr:CFI-box-CTERM domain-containing protein [Epilithonimonas sp. JDS]MCD9854565.1 hypothetical protein [Epilithonimonas sp. JDS]